MEENRGIMRYNSMINGFIIKRKGKRRDNIRRTL
jgi:hypothetical protein